MLNGVTKDPAVLAEKMSEYQRKSRGNARTPMQWNSSSPPSSLVQTHIHGFRQTQTSKLPTPHLKSTTLRRPSHIGQTYLQLGRSTRMFSSTEISTRSMRQMRGYLRIHGSPRTGKYCWWCVTSRPRRWSGNMMLVITRPLFGAPMDQI